MQYLRGKFKENNEWRMTDDEFNLLLAFFRNWQFVIVSGQWLVVSRQ
jgi:hypothetical protein